MHAQVWSRKLRKAVRGQVGAVDLLSIMVGILVMGLMGGVISATVFAVIPWAQDQAAKQQLASLDVAQSGYAGLTADRNAYTSASLISANPVKAASGDFAYGSLQELKDAGVFSAVTLADDGAGTHSDDYRLCTSAVSSDGYQSAVVSGSGKTWVKTAGTKARVATEGEDTCLGAITESGLPELTEQFEDDGNVTVPGGSEGSDDTCEVDNRWPTQVTRGDSFVWEVSDLEPNTTYDIFGWEDLIGSATTDGSGTFAYTVEIPANAPYGSATIDAIGGNDIVASADFLVVNEAPVHTNPSEGLGNPRSCDDGEGEQPAPGGEEEEAPTSFNQHTNIEFNVGMRGSITVDSVEVSHNGNTIYSTTSFNEQEDIIDGDGISHGQVQWYGDPGSYSDIAVYIQSDVPVAEKGNAPVYVISVTFSNGETFSYVYDESTLGLGLDDKNGESWEGGGMMVTVNDSSASWKAFSFSGEITEGSIW